MQCSIITGILNKLSYHQAQCHQIRQQHCSKLLSYFVATAVCNSN